MRERLDGERRLRDTAGRANRGERERLSDDDADGHAHFFSFSFSRPGAGGGAPPSRKPDGYRFSSSRTSFRLWAASRVPARVSLRERTSMAPEPVEEHAEAGVEIVDQPVGVLPHASELHALKRRPRVARPDLRPRGSPPKPRSARRPLPPRCPARRSAKSGRGPCEAEDSVVSRLVMSPLNVELREVLRASCRWRPGSGRTGWAPTGCRDTSGFHGNVSGGYCFGSRVCSATMLVPVMPCPWIDGAQPVVDDGLERLVEVLPKHLRADVLLDFEAHDDAPRAG